METRYCPQCGKANPASSRFCQGCGTPLAEATPATSAPTASAAPTPPSAAPAYPPAPSQQAAPAYVPAQPAYLYQPIGQMGTGGLSLLDIWGPFAGYGVRGRHVSWLLDNLGERAEALREAVTNRFRERQIPGAQVQPQTLTGRGLAVERRPYYLIKRGTTTAGLYIARFGQDLYISQVTYAKGSINTLRAVVLSLMVLFQVYLIFGYGGSLNSAIGSFGLLGGRTGGDPGSLTFLLCCIGPLGVPNTLGLLLVGLHMVYKFLTEKDPLMLLRTPPNEFQQDDIIALEKAVEETVRQSLDMIGIDSALMPAASEYGIKRRLI
jgi:hypothetical protein